MGAHILLCTWGAGKAGQEQEEVPDRAVWYKKHSAQQGGSE